MSVPRSIARIMTVDSGSGTATMMKSKNGEISGMFDVSVYLNMAQTDGAIDVLEYDRNVKNKERNGSTKQESELNKGTVMGYG
jgi:hypothetical protein